MSNTRPGSVLLLLVLFAVYSLELARGASTQPAALYALGALPDAGSLHQQWWRLLAYGFLHWNALHLLANTALLAWLAPMVERRLGATWMCSVFVSAVFAGGLAIAIMRAWWPAPGVTVGASAGAFALLALATGLLWQDADAPRAARIALALVLVFGLAASVLPGVSLLGHLAGALVGAAAFVALSAQSRAGRQARRMHDHLPRLLLSASLLLAGCAAAAGETRLDPKAPQGAIGGRVQFPAGVAPAMRICAITAAAQRCIDSPAGRTLYRIGELPDGDYQVVARVDNADTPVAGHVQEVQCIRAPCPPQLATLIVRDGKEIADADLNGFYAERPEFPALTD